jgi:hypothetical protein
MKLETRFKTFPKNVSYLFFKISLNIFFSHKFSATKKLKGDRKGCFSKIAQEDEISEF